ncbi:potassium uptake protein, TrkH family [Raineyella antarctica]|uniref:Potassium uptake protein, TrkH family n=1 Tax=Raineyella antarctica TaxID=1577474 RepID=A0A1G6GG96_9ACTN|nr:potassium transporter TrkG [Raineyella antarctica]SDB80765.1 potassium uptake protein, TrkH family [Raineyella antarctica]
MRLVRWLGHPARVIPAAYLAAIALGTALLMLPVATVTRRSADLIDAAFTAVSAICITGLVTVDTPTYWSSFGQVVILLLIQVGGFGIVTLATILTLFTTGHLSLHGSLLASQELHQRSLSDALRLPARIAAVMLGAELVTAAVLTWGFRSHADSWGMAAWYGVFHSVSAFNNAGFALFSSNLIGFVGAPAIILPICAAIVVGGLGFPVLFEVGRRWRRQGRWAWSAHTRLTIYGTVTLLVGGTLIFALAEWNNPLTLGPMPLGDRLLASLAGGVFPRTAGFNSIDYGAADESTLGLYYVLMFIGGGSAGTAGGIKVGTIGIILASVMAELRGEEQVIVAHRAIPTAVQRSALTVVMLGIVTVALATALIVALEPFSLQQVLFETISAFGTVGLSMGITAQLHSGSLVVLMLLMYLGRVGTISVATALAVRAHHRHYLLPEEQPIVG